MSFPLTEGSFLFSKLSFERSRLIGNPGALEGGGGELRKRQCVFGRSVRRLTRKKGRRSFLLV